MEFWGVEVKAGQPLKVSPGDDKMIHLSQASLGESKKEGGNEFIPIHVKIDDQKLVLGTLSPANFPQIAFDLVFEKEFELSHNWKHGSVYFCGYQADSPSEMSDFGSSDEEEEEEDELDLPITNAPNGRVLPNAVKAKPETSNAAAKPKVKVVEPKKDEISEDGSDSDDSDDIMDSASEDDSSDSEDGSDDEDDSDDEEEETPKKVASGKKRTPESASETPVTAKKAKLATPQKTDGKKSGGHTATPYPSKQAGKTPAAASSEKSKAKSPKSAGSVSCKTCSKTFGSETGLLSHTKAKHEGK